MPFPNWYWLSGIVFWIFKDIADKIIQISYSSRERFSAFVISEKSEFSNFRLCCSNSNRPQTPEIFIRNLHRKNFQVKIRFFHWARILIARIVSLDFTDLRIHKEKAHDCVRIRNKSRLGMSLYPASFWGKSKDRSRVASKMFPAEMAKSMEMSFKNLERW